MNDTRTSFGLTRPSRSLDPRTQAMRGDLADIALAGKLFAPHYAVPLNRACIVSHAPMLERPGGEQVSELLQGEGFALLDVSGGWAWGYSLHDHYVGYIANCALGAPSGTAPTLVTGDPVAVAEGFMGMPYVWGGRGGEGIDCSGLVQRSLASIHISAPRDSDMQMSALGQPINEADVQRGDLIFFPGHVGMMHDKANLLHATIFHGKTVIEPLADVTMRTIAKTGIGISGVKRVLP